MNRTVKYQGAFSRIVGFVGKRFLFSPPPAPSTFFCFRSNFRAITRLETLATQASVRVNSGLNCKMESRTIECVAFFYHEGAKGDDFIQKNKFRYCVDSSQWGSVVKLGEHVR